MAEDDDFLSRWSRRKAEARAGLKKKRADDGAAEAPARADDAPGTAAAAQGGQVALREHADEAPRELTPEEAEEAYKDFDFDALDAQSDYTQFMRKGVPEWVRQKALRKLWTSDPVFANLDGLVDYGEDFTDAALAVKDLVTSWKPGQGYLSDEEVQRNREEYGPEEQRLAARREREEREAAAREAEAREAGAGDDGTGDTGDGEDGGEDGEAVAQAPAEDEAAADADGKARDDAPPRQA